MLETYMKLCMAEPDIPEKNFLPPKSGKLSKFGPETRFF